MLTHKKEHVMQARNFITKFSAKNNKNAHVNFYKIPATTKWVEYQLDIYEMNAILMKSDFDTKIRLLDALTVAERKRDYMYRHPNFDFNKATYLFSVLKDAKKVPNYAPKQRG
jgi:hypothetical protein